jgi:hypothetical protein
VKNGLLTVRAGAAEEVPAVHTGVLLGAGARGPVHLRLLRQSGTRIATAAGLPFAQLIALRAAIAAVPVDVVTGRRAAWESLRAAAPAIELRSPNQLVPHSGPALVLYDHSAPAAAPAPGQGTGAQSGPFDARPWQCRLDVYPEWTADQATIFAAAHLAVIGRVSAADVARLASSFGLPAEMLAALPALPAETVALLRRGWLEFVRIEPVDAELAVLAGTGAQPTAPRIAP